MMHEIAVSVNHLLPVVLLLLPGSLKMNLCVMKAICSKILELLTTHFALNGSGFGASMGQFRLRGFRSAEAVS